MAPVTERNQRTEQLNGSERIDVPLFVKVITGLTGTIAVVLGVWAAIATDSHPQYVDGAYDVVLSWGARALGIGLACFVAVFFIRDARGYVIALAASWVREVLDLIDLFRVEGDFRTQLWGVLIGSVVLHSTALFLSVRAVTNSRASTSVRAQDLGSSMSRATS